MCWIEDSSLQQMSWRDVKGNLMQRNVSTKIRNDSFLAKKFAVFLPEICFFVPSWEGHNVVVWTTFFFLSSYRRMKKEYDALEKEKNFLHKEKMISGKDRRPLQKTERTKVYSYGIINGLTLFLFTQRSWILLRQKWPFKKGLSFCGVYPKKSTPLLFQSRERRGVDKGAELLSVSCESAPAGRAPRTFALSVKWAW